MAYAALSTQNSSGLHPNFRGLGFLGDTPIVSAEEAVRQAVASESNIDPRDASGWLNPTNPAWASVLQSGQISAAAFSPSCATQAAPNVNLFQTGSTLALGTSAAGVGIAGATGAIAASTAALAGAAIMGVGAVIGIIGVIFAHHAAAVRQEQQLGCAAIGAWNNSISLIDRAVANGQMTPEAASAGMDELYSKISSYIAPAVSHSPFCSADCELLIECKAIMIYRKAQFAAMGTQQNIAAAQQTSADQTRAATLEQQANAAQASGDTATANVLRAQAAELQPSPSIPGWAWLVGLGFLAAWAM